MPLQSGHVGLSDKALLKLDFELPIKRKALLSDNSGWKSYDISIQAEVSSSSFTFDLSVGVDYSSTCPCSASLARQLLQEKFSADFTTRETVSVSEVEGW
ncbi:GTP cyclohydrolase FolE2 [Marinobacterium sp. xm-v-242]|jgi:GTP cyclohydrolase I|nr:GTP cyclohydrolase FolE2 [Marinobacterium sp. xm-d-543]NRP52811.1 GTP cyclohydrolase FolE2 [Marinobacterium sp. xm-v-242]NRP77392.1 GTP cyclohydrolase FolE2 [Marinobacterium sp. xm-m-383]